MSEKYSKETSRISCIDSEGKEVTVVERTQFERHYYNDEVSEVPGYKSYSTVGGEPVKPMPRGAAHDFELVRTGESLSRI